MDRNYSTNGENVSHDIFPKTIITKTFQVYKYHTTDCRITSTVQNNRNADIRRETVIVTVTAIIFATTLLVESFSIQRGYRASLVLVQTTEIIVSV